MTGTIDAALLEAAAALFEAQEARALFLASPTDLRPRVEPPLPADDVMLAIGMLCTPYLVSEESGDTLAGDIGRQITREVARGESHLFNRFGAHRQVRPDGRRDRVLPGMGRRDAAEHHVEQPRHRRRCRTTRPG